MSAGENGEQLNHMLVMHWFHIVAAAGCAQYQQHQPDRQYYHHLRLTVAERMIRKKMYVDYWE